MPPYELIDISGKTFGSWTVLSMDTVRGTNRMWRCRCICGDIRLITGTKLRMGRTKSCRKCAQARLRAAPSDVMLTLYAVLAHGAWQTATRLSSQVRCSREATGQRLALLFARGVVERRVTPSGSVYWRLAPQSSPQEHRLRTASLYMADVAGVLAASADEPPGPLSGSGADRSTSPERSV